MKFGNDPKMSESKKNITQVKVQFKFAIDLTLSEVGFLQFQSPTQKKLLQMLKLGQYIHC